LCSKCQPTLICTYCGRSCPEEVCRQCSNTYCQYRTNPIDFSYSADTTQIDSSRSLIHDPSNNPDLAENAPTALDKNCVVCNPELIADGNQYICSVCAGGHEDCTQPDCNFCKEIAERTLEALNLTDLTLGSGLAFESPSPAWRDSSCNKTQMQTSEAAPTSTRTIGSKPLQERFFQETPPSTARIGSGRKLVLKKSMIQRFRRADEGESDADDEMTFAHRRPQTAPKMSSQSPSRPRPSFDYHYSRTPTEHTANYEGNPVSCRGDATFSLPSSPSKRSKKATDSQYKWQDKGQRFFCRSQPDLHNRP